MNGIKERELPKPNLFIERELEALPATDESDEMFTALAQMAFTWYAQTHSSSWPEQQGTARRVPISARIGQLYELILEPTRRIHDGYRGIGCYPHTALGTLVVCRELILTANPGRGYIDRWETEYPRSACILDRIHALGEEIIKSIDTSRPPSIDEYLDLI